ncbi:MAG TPA: hypothetical protein VMY39_07590, partial [Planctomycetota bacterium]|nr:hypothetical protein [Planctomycetota bacterium]
MQPRPHNPADAMPLHRESMRRRTLLVAVAAVVLALAAFSPALFTRTFTDDADSVLRVGRVSHVKHLRAIFSREFTAHTGGRYRPFPYAVLALGRTVARPENALFWNLWLLGFHVLNALLVYGVARHFARRETSALAALAVALFHPAASSFTHRIDLFPDVLAGTLYLGTLLAYLGWGRRRRLSLYVLSLVLLAMGLVSSRAFVTLPVLLLLYEVLYERTVAWRAVLRVLPMAVLIVPAAVLYRSMHPAPAFWAEAPRAFGTGTWYGWVSTVGGGLDTVLGLLRGRSAEVPVGTLTGDVHHAWNGAFLVATAVVAVLLAAAFLAMRLRRHWTGVGLFLLFVATCPALPMYRDDLSEDYASWTFRYLSYVGLALLVGGVLDALPAWRRAAVRWGALAATSALVLCCLALLVVDNLHARSPEGWWRHVLDENRASQQASVKLGEAYLRQARDARRDGDETLAREKERVAFARLYGPPVRYIRESALVLAVHYRHTGNRDAAVAHLGIADRQEEYGLLYQEDVLTRVAILRDAQAYDFAEERLGLVLAADPSNTR